MPSLSIPTGVFGSTAAKVAVAVAFLAVGGVAAAQIGAFDGVMDTNTHEAIDQVPDGVDSVAAVDPGVLDRDVSARLYVTAYNATVGAQAGPENETEAGDTDDDETDFGDDDGMTTTSPAEMVPANLTAALDETENETGLDPRVAEDVVFFQQRRNFTQPQYAGAIVHADWDKNAVHRAVENDSETDYVNTTVNGAIVYKPEDTGNESDEEEMTFGAPEPEQWVAILNDGEYVFGTEEAVNDTINVEYGDAKALDGDLRSAFDETRDGYFRYAQRSQNVNVTRINQTMGRQTGLNVTAYAQAYNDLHVTSGSYYITDDGDALGFQSRTLTNSTDTARDVKDLTQGFISIQAGAIQNETIENELRSTDVTRDGTTVTVTRETSIETVERLIRWFGAAVQDDSQRGMAAQPIA